MEMKFLPTIAAKRTEAATRTAEVAAARLATRGHQTCELFADGAHTKLYLDRDEYLAAEPTRDELSRAHEAVRERVQAIVDALEGPGRPLTFKIATRHGRDT